MSGERRCGACRHYEPSLDARHGWCRNPRLLGPGRSQPVAAIDLACAYRGGDYWEPIDSADWLDFPADPEPPEPIPRFGTEGDVVQHTASEPLPPFSREAALYNDVEPDAEVRPDEQAAQDRAADAGRYQRPNSGSIGQEPLVSYQPEERYWTDYLRIALPIAGLLLLLGVFWYWASSFIGDDDEDPNQSTQIAVVETPITAATQTPTVSVAVTLPPAQTVAPTQAAEQAQPTTDTSQPTPTGEAAENGGTDSTFVEGDLVVVNDNDVNLRTEPTTGDVITVLSNGDELNILDSTPQDDGTYIWWNVSTVDGEEGWVAGDFLDPSGGG